LRYHKTLPNEGSRLPAPSRGVVGTALGCLIEKANIVKILLSIEIMILAAAINLCYASTSNAFLIGDILAVVSVVMSGVISGIIFSLKIHGAKQEQLLDE
jgi:NADH:ubiquinone oxidoreductase subunit K